MSAYHCSVYNISKDHLNELINCQICGDTSTGFHYGVHSCEGCKGFFRRSIAQHTTYTCTNKERCEVTIYTRNQCQLCRWKKCLDVGMSKDASRLGRRSKRMIERMQDMIADKQQSPQDLKRYKLSGSDGDFARQMWGPARPDMYSDMSGDQGSSSFYQRSMNIKSEDPPPTCAYAKMKYSNSVDGESSESSRLGLPSSQNAVGVINSSIISNINGVSASAINQMLLSGQPVMLIPQQIGSASQNMAVQGQVPPAVIVVKQSDQSDSNKTKLREQQKDCVESPGSGVNSMDWDNEREQKVPDNLNFSEKCAPMRRLDSSPRTVSSPPEQNESTKGKPWQQQMEETSPQQPVLSPGASDLKFGQIPSPGCGLSPLSPFLSSPLCSPGKLFPFETPTPSPQDGSQPSKFVPMVFPDVEFDEPTPEQRQTIANLVQGVTKLHHNICHFTYARIHMLKEKYYGIRESMFDSKGRPLHDCRQCPLPPQFPTAAKAPKELDMPNHEITPAHMIRFFANKFTGLITRIVMFTRQIPGFRQLDKEDQITLIKQGLFEVAATRFTTVVDLETQMVNYWTTGDTFTRDLARESPLGRLIDLLFDFAARFNKFELTDDEIGILNAVLMVAADRPGLKKREEVRELQSNLLKGLQYEVQRTHPEDPGLFARILTTIPKLREIGPEHTKRLMELKVQNAKLTNLSPLHSEVFDLAE
ncbi:nuclear receptor subfamily 1 group D member 2-like isoform X2 [Glandiceps talaboti]